MHPSFRNEPLRTPVEFQISLLIGLLVKSPVLRIAVVSSSSESSESSSGIFKTGFATNTGRVRSENEDRAFADCWLLVVADGMGGHQAGEVASEITVSTIRNACSPAPLGADDSNLAHPHLSDLVKATVDANSVIIRAAIEDPSKQGMGTTVTALSVIVDPTINDVPLTLGLINVGDSRTYVMRNQRLRQVTKDHSFVQDLIDNGQISKEEARTHPRRNIVTRALGIEPDVRVDSAQLPMIKGDRYLLCSDGLVDEVSDEHIEKILCQYSETQDAADALVRAANESGGRDNVTVVVADVLEGDEISEPTEEYDLGAIFGVDEITGEVTIVEVDADPGHEPAPVKDTPVNQSYRSTGRRFIQRFAIGIAAVALIVVAISIAGAWVRSSYTVSFTESGTVMIYRGRDVLWFSPTEEAPGLYRRDQLDSLSVGLVQENRQFDTLDAAAQFVQSLTTAAGATTSNSSN